jgi:hypothetical protein
MSKHKEVTTVGPIEWARLFEGNRDKTGYNGQYEDCEGAYTVAQKLSKAEFEKLKKTGSLKRPNQNRMMEAGELVVKFERKHLVKTKEGSVIEAAGGAPKVLRADGKLWNSDEDGLIGNGSIAEITHLVSPFTAPDGTQSYRTSLVKVKILEHVQYVRPEEGQAA